VGVPPRLLSAGVGELFVVLDVYRRECATGPARPYLQRRARMLCEELGLDYDIVMLQMYRPEPGSDDDVDM